MYRIWREGPCSLSFTSTSHKISKAERFKHFSIYHRDDVSRKKKVFDDIQKPELLLLHFRRELKDAQRSKFYNTRGNKITRKQDTGNHQIRQILESYKKKVKTESTDILALSQTASTQVKSKEQKDNPFDFRLKKKQTPLLWKSKGYQDPVYDFFGMRTGQFKSDNSAVLSKKEQNQMRLKTMPMCQTFSFSKRLDLSRPLNFNPGPGQHWPRSEIFSKTINKNRVQRMKTMDSQRSQEKLNRSHIRIKTANNTA